MQKISLGLLKKKTCIQIFGLIFLNISGRAAATPGTHYDNGTMFIHKHFFCEVRMNNVDD